MRAIRIHEYGPPEVLRLEQLPDPEPAEGEVLVESDAIGVLYSETQVRAGQLARFGVAGPQPPFVFGRDVVGRVVAAGPGADAALVGQRVIASTTGTGAYAERVVVPASGVPTSAGAVFSCVVAIPDGLDVDTAAALIGHGRTALGVARTAQIAEGDVVLITAAGGAIGTLLIQLARASGASTVVAAARGERKLAVAKDLGADVVVDYSRPEWHRDVREAVNGGVNVVLDAVGGEIARTAFDLACDGQGTVVIYGLSSGSLARLPADELLRRGLTLTGFSGARLARRPQWVTELQTEILDLAVRGVVKPVVGRKFRLEEAAAAHAAVESRDTVGKTILIP
jgi:NADPH2:quinone reductase